MGLSISVGYLADLIASDPEGADSFRSTMEQLNGYMRLLGLPPHQEPDQCEQDSFDMYGYAGIHYLRRIAAHLELRGVLPSPGGEDASKDEVVEEYYRLATEPPAGFFSKLFRRAPRPRTFDHLLLHSDAEGYYLPMDFATVLFPPTELKIPGGMIGSSVRLGDECKRLAGALQAPLELDPEGEELWQACQSQGTGELHWQQYGIESFTCIRLYAACKASLKARAAIVFC